MCKFTRTLPFLVTSGSISDRVLVFEDTFGATTLLPTLPIVTGFRTCDGTETNLFGCAAGGAPIDRDCWIGCRGADGQSGTPDDSIDPT